MTIIGMKLPKLFEDAYAAGLREGEYNKTALAAELEIADATIEKLTAERDAAYERAAVACDKETDRHSIYSPAQAAMKSAAAAIRALKEDKP